MIRGFVLGKFMPIHEGHKHMLDFATKQCDVLTILVCALDSEPIPGFKRYEWMKHEYPNARVLYCNEDLLQEPRSEDDEEFWAQWRDVMKRYHPERIHRVFGSEDYVVRLAKEAGDAEPFIVDKERKMMPVSGTAIRNDPYTNWKYIPEVVRPYFNKRVLITGPESCGKTTMARELARIYETTWTPEYAREYIEDYMGNDMKQLNREHMLTFCNRHYGQEDLAHKNATHVTFSDTSAIETYIYAKLMLPEERTLRFDIKSYIHKNRYDLVLLLKPDIPWEEEEQRTYGDRREEIYQIFKDTYDKLGIPYVEVGGMWEERIGNAALEVMKLFKGA